MHKIIQLGNLAADTEKFKNRTVGRVYSIEGISPTINTIGGGSARAENCCKEEE